MQQLDWANLKFAYSDTDCHIRCVWRDGAWSEPEIIRSSHMQIHIAASALHYGQAAFEGLKAFRGRDGAVRIFRPQANAERLQQSARRVCMEAVPTDLFVRCCELVVRNNMDYMPPYGTGASMYLRPLLFGSGAMLGVAPATEFTFLLIAVPVGPYYKGGLQSVDAALCENYDRAAPLGVGSVKVAGNYAAGLLPSLEAKKKGCPITLFLDAREHRYVDEFTTSNFVAVKDDTYITPDSPSILPSVTNRTLMQLAQDIGMKVVRRPVEVSELGSFEGIAACGTAVVLTPVARIISASGELEIGRPGIIHPRFSELYERLQAIQYGEAFDQHQWCHVLA